MCCRVPQRTLSTSSWGRTRHHVASDTHESEDSCLHNSSNPLGHEHWRIFALLRTVLRLAGAFRTAETVLKGTKTIRKALPILYWPAVAKLEILCVPKTDQNRYLANRSGIWVFRMFWDISGKTYGLSKPIPTLEQTLTPSTSSGKIGQKKSPMSTRWHRQFFLSDFSRLQDGPYGRMVLSAFPLGTLLFPKIPDSMFWSPYGGPTDLWPPEAILSDPKDACSHASFGFELSAQNYFILSRV